MSDGTVPRLKFDPNPTQTAGSIELLVINEGGVPAGGPHQSLKIDLLVPRSILALQDQIARLTGTTSHVSLANTPFEVHADSGAGAAWTTWLRLPERNSESMVIISLLNDRDDQLKSRPAYEWGEIRDVMSIRIPLLPVVHAQDHTSVEILCAYRAGAKPQSVHVTLSAGRTQAPSQVPSVSFGATRGGAQVDDPMTLKAGEKLDLNWHVAGGEALSGRLQGLLPGGRREQELSPANRDYKPDQGKITVQILNHQTYLLDLTVKLPDQSKMRVVRTLAFDVFSPNELGRVWLNQEQVVLPYGTVRVDWAAWGVRRANLEVRYPANTLQSTSIDVVPDTEGVLTDGQGYEDVIAPVAGRTEAILTIWTEAGFPVTPPVDPVLFTVEDWDNAAFKSLPTQRPVSLAYDHGGWLVLCTADGKLWRARVGLTDNDPNGNHQFEQIGTQGANDRWLAVSGYQSTSGFAALRIKATGEAELVRFTAQATEDGTPITLPGFAGSSRAQLVALGEDIFATAERDVAGNDPFQPSRWAPMPLRVSRVAATHEPVLMAARGAALVVLDDAIYALHQLTGDLLRFGREGDGLGHPKMAQSAGAGKVARGVPLVIEDLLVVLGSGQGSRPQDMVYSHRYNTWSTCGQGLAIDRASGAAVFRGGTSRRLFAFGGTRAGGNGDSGQTLAVASYLDLFFWNAIHGNTPESLPFDYLDTEFVLPATFSSDVANAFANSAEAALIAPGTATTSNLAPIMPKISPNGDLSVAFNRQQLPVGFLGLHAGDQVRWWYLYRDSGARSGIGAVAVPLPACKDFMVSPPATFAAGQPPQVGMTGKFWPILNQAEAVFKAALDASSDPQDRAARVADIEERVIPEVKIFTVMAPATLGQSLPGVQADASRGTVSVDRTLDQSPLYGLHVRNLAGSTMVTLRAELANRWTLVLMPNAPLAIERYQAS